MNYTVFRITNWYVQVSHVAKTYKEIRAFLTDPILTDKFLDNKIDAINAIEHAKVEWNNENTALFKEVQGQTFDRALEFYERQIIVTIGTYVELVLKEFLTLVFRKFPERMFEYVNIHEKQKGLVDVKEIINSSSLEELLSNLAEQAAINALSGRIFKTHLKRIKTITKEEKFPDNLENRLVDIIEHRNRIVHEGSKEKVTLDQIKMTVDSYIDLLIFFNKIAKKSGIRSDNDLTGKDFEILERNILWLGLS